LVSALKILRDFHGEWQHERMTIQYVEPQDPRALLELHGQEMSDSLLHSTEFSNTFFFGMIFFNGLTQRPVFVLFTKNCNLNVATFRAHLLHPFEDSDYPNYALVKVPSNLCHVKRGCVCNLQHTQLFEYKRLLVICTATTEGGKLVSTMKHLPLLDAPDYKVFTFLDKYKMSSLKEYKTKRVDLHAPYLM